VDVLPAAVDSAVGMTEPALREGRYVRMTVGDTGHGMDEATLERVFDPFFTTKPLGEGTGLGLAVVHGIVVSHGGAIRVQSTLNRGTTFDVYFPVAEGSRLEAGAASPVPHGEGQRILYVDDEGALCLVFQRALTALGYQVETFTSPDAALDRFLAGPDDFQLVISDLSMPGINGRELATRVRATRPAIPVMIVTGFTGTLTADKVKELRLSAVLNKPLDMAALGHAVHGALRPEKRIN
jgi:CheY-like chemotaxis protein